MMISRAVSGRSAKPPSGWPLSAPPLQGVRRFPARHPPESPEERPYHRLHPSRLPAVLPCPPVRPELHRRSLRHLRREPERERQAVHLSLLPMRIHQPLRLRP